MKGFFDLIARLNIHRHAFALAAILRLDHDRQAYAQRDFPGFIDGLYGCTDRDGYASGMQKVLGEILVLCDGFGYRAGGIDFGCLDTALSVAPAYLHK